MITVDSVTNYIENGIIIHPLVPVVAGNRNTGKAPIVKGWESRTTQYDTAYLQHAFSNGANVGANCGKASDLTVIDVDYYVKGIWEYVFEGIDTSKFVIQQRTEKDGKKHYLFKYSPELKTCTNHELGFDIRNDGGNIVLSPSVHYEGDIYKLLAPIETRPELPKIVAERINEVIEIYTQLKASLAKCRPCFYKLWKAVFVDESSDLYHDVTVFRRADGRLRHLALFAELKANGATDEQLLIACVLIFGEFYDNLQTNKGIRKIEPKTAKNTTLQADEYYKRFMSFSEPATINVGATEIYKELTEEEIKLLGREFAERHLICDLPEDHYISQFTAYTSRISDAYSEYSVLASLWLLSSFTQNKVYIDLATHTRGLAANVWGTIIGYSSLSRKTTILDIARAVFSFSQSRELVDCDGSLEGYLESLANEPMSISMHDECSILHSKMGQKYNAGYFEFECKVYDGVSQEKRLASGGKKEPKCYLVRDPFSTKLHASTFVKYARSITAEDFDSGYGYRFLYAAPLYDRPLRPERMRTPEDIDAMSSLCARSAKLYDLFQSMPKFNMSVDDDAFEYYTKISTEFIKYIKNQNNEIMGSAWSRYGPYILKIAALLEIGKSTVSTRITRESIIKAASMVTDYFMPTLCDVYGLLTTDVKNNRIDLIISELKKSNGVAKHSTLLRKSKLERRDFISCIETMYESKQIDIVLNKSSNGIDAKTYILRDLDAVKFTMNCDFTKNPNSPIPQVPQIPLLSCKENILGTGELVKKFKEFDCTRLDDITVKSDNDSLCTENKQLKEVYQFTSSEENKVVLEQENLRNLGNWGTGNKDKDTKHCGQVTEAEALNILDGEGL